MDSAALRSARQPAEVFGPEIMIHSIRASGGTNICGGVRVQDNRVDLKDGLCSYKVPQLLHLSCSHLMTAFNARGLEFKRAMHMSPLYSREHTICICESIFEPYFDLSQWPEYNGPEYVPHPGMKTEKKGRRANKRITGDMDVSQGRSSADYGTCNFEAPKTKKSLLQMPQNNYRLYGSKKEI